MRPGSTIRPSLLTMTINCGGWPAAGARIRSEALDARIPADLTMTPRGVIVAGAEARLIRAVLEPVCPVPLIAWPLPGLPGWVGALDLVVVLASEAEGYRAQH